MSIRAAGRPIGAAVALVGAALIAMLGGGSAAADTVATPDHTAAAPPSIVTQTPELTHEAEPAPLESLALSVSPGATPGSVGVSGVLSNVYTGMACPICPERTVTVHWLNLSTGAAGAAPMEIAGSEAASVAPAEIPTGHGSVAVVFSGPHGTVPGTAVLSVP